MELYVGGTAQGKLTYVLEKQNKNGNTITVADGESCTAEEIKKADIINHLHLFVKRWLEEGKPKEELLDAIKQADPKVLLICDEVGAGVVPMKREERDWRETVGRLCCELAKEADRVERIICGIGVRVK